MTQATLQTPQRALHRRPKPGAVTRGTVTRRGALAALLVSAPLMAQAPLQGAPERLGTVDFPVSCSADAQKQMTRRLALYHSYYWPEARKSFSAADHEDRTEKSVVTPGPLKPARELLGDMLMENKQAALALSAFEAVLHKEPNRMHATLGAARAAEQSGDQRKARLHYTALAKLLEGADAERPERAQASAYLAR